VNRILRPGLVLLSLLCVTACEQEDAAFALPQERLQPAPGCELARGCVVHTDEVRIDVRSGSVPRALQPFVLQLRQSGLKGVDDVTVAFLMRGMDMGESRYRLLRDGTGQWHADITLPICVSGRSDWVAAFELVLPDRRLQFDVPFVLIK